MRGNPAVGSVIAALVVASVVGCSTRPAGPAESTAQSGSDLRTVITVDGDTVKLEDGQSIRVIGIDTPERGECGYGEASAMTAQMVSSGVVLSLPNGHEAADDYHRLLRSVTTADGQDLGLALIQAGWANARYDSVDGYDHHPQQEQYRAASAATAHQCPHLDGDTAGS